MKQCHLCENVPASSLSDSAIINAGVQMNRETQGNKQAEAPTS